MMNFEGWKLMMRRTAILLAVCWLPLSGRSSVVYAQTELSGEDALQADLAEAVEMLENSQFELLTFDFMPADIASEMRQISMRRYGRVDNSTNALSAFPQPMKNQLISELKAAQSGKITWNRNKSLAWIQFTTKPIELVPAQKSGYVPPDLESATASEGLGSDVDGVLAKAIGLLESKRLSEFGRAMLPLEQAAELNDEAAIERWVHRLKTHPKMVDAMIRDLKAAQAAAKSTMKRQSDNRVSIEIDSSGAILQLMKVAGSWRLAGLNSAQQAEYQKLANSEIAATVVPAQMGTVVLTYTEGRWRLMAMPTRIPTASNAKSGR